MKFLFFFCVLSLWTLVCNSQVCRDIVLVNVESLDRSGIAKEISIISALNPKVIAIDLQFSTSRNDPNDAELVKALWSSKNLIMPSLIYTLADNTFISSTAQSEFSPVQAKLGFVNVLQEDDTLNGLKRFLVQEQETMGGRRNAYHFAVQTAMLYDSLSTMRFVKKNPGIVDIDYKKGKRKFKKYSAESLFRGNLSGKDIAGKIVMIGFLGPGDEDKFYTPLNKNPMEPDMYGLEYLANIVSQVLEFGHK